MTIHENLAELSGRPVVDWRIGEPIPDPTTAVPRIRAWEDGFPAFEGLAADLLVPAIDAFVAAGGGAHPVLVIGSWGQAYDNPVDPVVEALVRHAGSLGALTALFLGDITMEEAEMSWICQGDVTPLLRTFPLTDLWVRGGTDLVLQPVECPTLTRLVIETGGLPGPVAEAVAGSHLPGLRHLELWLGTAEYGRSTGAAELAPILEGRLPITRLGLRNAEGADEVARWVADAPVLDQLDVLDLSLGDLTDAGAEVLLASARVRSLRRLVLHHHFVSQPVVDRLLALPIEVDASDPQEAHVYDGVAYRSIFVSE